MTSFRCAKTARPRQPRTKTLEGNAPETTGRAALLDYQRAGQAAGAITAKRHVASNIVLTADDDRIIATYYLSVMERETLPALIATAVITDEFEKRDGIWMIVAHVTSVDPAVMNLFADK